MKNITKQKVFIYTIFLLIVFQFTNCSEKYNVEIITEDDSSYVEFDSLSFFTESGIDQYNSKWQKEHNQMISELYIASDRGKKKFEYIFYVNEEGKYKKVRIIKSLNEEADLQFINFKTKNYSGKGKLGNKIVKYKIIVNNETFHFSNWENVQSNDIPIVIEDDQTYKALQKIKYRPTGSFELLKKNQKEDLINKNKVIISLKKKLSHSEIDLQHMKRLYINDLPIGFTTSYHVLYINKKGQLDKIRVISGLPSKIEDLVTSYFPIIEFPKYIVSGDSVKYKFILKTNILVNYPGQIDEIVNTIRYDEEPIIASIARKNKIIEVIEYVDSQYVNFSELDNIPEFPNAYFWGGIFPILDKETKMEFELYYKSTQKTGTTLFSDEGEDEFRLTLYFDINGFVEKVNIVKGHGEKLNNSLLKIITQIHILKGEIEHRPVKYKAKFKLYFADIRNRPNSLPVYFAGIINPLFRKNIHELPESYTEKDFMVLPDVTAKPIGGYSGIAKKVTYPEIAIRYKKEGEVSVKSYVNETGKVIGVQVLRAEGYGFEEAAVEAIKKTKFEPAYQDGKPIKSIYVIPIEFILDSGEIKIRRERIDAYKLEEEPETKENSEPIQSANKEDNYFIIVDDMPLPIGGIDEIQNKITYPKLARRAGVQGRVFVKAFVGYNGNVEKTEILKGIGAGCDEEAMRAIKETKFTPGRLKGKAVKVQVSIPVLFSLESKDDIDSTKHFGYWVGASDTGEEIKIWFLKNGYTELYKGKAGRMDGKITAAKFGPKFKINYNTSPVELDLKYFGIGGIGEGKQLCILKFNSPNEIEIGVPIGFNHRPKNYSQTEIREIWTLRKIK
ncbi:MAG: energy transducer TonB [Ignavibacteriae bacterium]|nr:energy transducer TonB [Ignavibacteriota bacterium]